MVKDIFKTLKDEESREFRLCAEFEENFFMLTLLQNSNAWIAHVQPDEIIAFAKNLELDPTEYYLKVKQMLTDIPNKGVDFKVTSEDFTMFCNLDNKIRIKYFSCPVKKVVYSKCVENLLHRCYLERTELLKIVESTSKLNDDLRESKTKVENALKEIIERKKCEDQELYSSFVLVLNEKKRKTQQLNQLLEAFKQGRPTQNPKCELKKKYSSKSVVKEEVLSKEDISNSDSDGTSASYQTDEKLSENDEINVLPSTSNHQYNFLLEDSPPRVNPPKRKKVEEDTSERRICIADDSKLNCEEIKMEVNTERNEKLPDISFSTQDLLDHI